MSELTIKEFMKLNDVDKKTRYVELSFHDKFLWRTQYSPLGCVSFGEKVEFTEEEKMKNKRDFEKILKTAGVLKENEELK